ncbi:ferritin-like domain-containing protein [Planctomycetes bacterium TBK1r]|uniref:Oxygen-dependent dichlorochromopyrrolate synthase n=1 Tax=Stieleria magnilauensis TaxID=2527963 RepID=A0ABX5XMA0_9BACT|nr:Oxygen-dependent dichlorochromopyrrolate synthase [Planctomycetes bacterium TBK1r]
MATRRTRHLRFSRPASVDFMALGAGPLAAAAASRAIGHDPPLSDRDEFIFLLHTAAEIEHALMVQYLYAWFSLRPVSDFADPEQQRLVGLWSGHLRMIAMEEMGHLLTVQNLLRSVGGPLNLEREDMPFRSGLYPFPFQLEPLSRDSLSKYVFAEMPSNLETDPAYADVVQRARRVSPDDLELNHVGVLFARLSELAATLPRSTFQPSSETFQGTADNWGQGYEESVPGSGEGLIIRSIRNRDDAVAAINDIGEQGEGMSSPINDADDPVSHFRRFFDIYEAFPEPDAWRATRHVPTHPNTTLAPQSDDGVDVESGADDFDRGRITHPVSRGFAQLANGRYRMLLAHLLHSLSIPSAEDSDSIVGHDELVDWTFDEMHELLPINRLIVQRPLGDEEDEARAGLPFELPYTLAIPDEEDNRWRLHRDSIENSAKIIASLRELGLNSDEIEYLDRLETRDEVRKETVAEFLRQTSDDDTLHAIRIFPPIAIARLGSATEPLDNYDFELDDDGRRTIRGAETLVVDRATGTITEVRTPNEVRFKDDGRIRPVCPFLEIWAQLQQDGDYEPLSISKLRELGGQVKWRVRAANLKAWRRTGDDDDKVQADTGEIQDHDSRELVGRCSNFKPGIEKSIPLGSVQFIRPTDEFPELRLRFTPAVGSVFGPNADDPNTVDDVYDSTRGNWVGHRDGAPGTPLFTFPGGIYARDAAGNSAGYLDDTCDAIVEAIVTVGEREFVSTARVSSGPPDFAPDSLPLRSVTDDAQQILLGPQPGNAANAVAESRELIRRTVESIRLMNTDALNERGMPNHDRGAGRLGEPIFRPPARARYAAVVGFHQAVLSSLDRLEDNDTPANRAAARSSLIAMQQRLREYDEVGDLTDAGRQKMPAMMRGSDGRYLALTRRLLNQIQLAIDELESSPDPVTPEQAMIALIESKAAFANRHLGIQTDGGGSLASLFADPPALLRYLQTETVVRDIIPELEGEPLIRPQDPANSAFLSLITNSAHPMFFGFDQALEVPIVEAWINSLPLDDDPIV